MQMVPETMIKFNTHNTRPYIIKVPFITTEKTCCICGNKLSKFDKIALYTPLKTIILKGKVCVDCDAIYVSDKIPNRVIDDIEAAFSEDVLIEQLQRKTKGEHKNEQGGIQRISTTKNTTILPTSRSKPRINTV